MNHESLLKTCASASRRSLIGSGLLLTAILGLLAWNVHRLQQIQAIVADQAAELQSLIDEKDSLTETLRSIKDAPDGGVRAMVQRVNVSEVMHDFFLWVDVRNLSDKKVLEVRYDFADDSYKDITSTVAATGFGAYFRGPIRPGEPVCPGRTQVTIIFENAPPMLIDYDLCTVVGL
jgi:hypothetical protein